MAESNSSKPRLRPLVPGGVSRQPARAPWWARPLIGMHDLLDVSGPVTSADAIFVFAGRPERKRFGVELWHHGVAETLVISVARFEWRGVAELRLSSDGGLRALVDQTPPARRHFLITLERKDARAEWIPRGRLGTWSEALAVARLARERGWRSLLLITTAAHSRRTMFSVKRALRSDDTRISMVSVPEMRSSVRRDSWWRDRSARRLVLREWIKLPVYALFARERPIPAPPAR